MKDENKDEYFIIKKHKWFDHTSYEIMKAKPFDQTQAIRILLAYEQLNDTEEKTYFLQEGDLLLGQEKPLVLKDEVKDTSLESVF